MGHSAGRQRRVRGRHGRVLDVYQRPHDPERPLVCVDETSKQLIAETRVPIAAKPGRAGSIRLRVPAQWHRQSVHDVRAAGRLAARQGHRSPYGAWIMPRCSRNCPTRTSRRRTKIVLVQDNLNTHKPASLYEAFPPPRPAGSSSGSSGTTRPNTAAGWTWRNPNLLSCRLSASTGASRINKR